MNEPAAADERAFAEGVRVAYDATPLPGPDAIHRIQATVREAGAPDAKPSMLRAWLEPRTFRIRPALAAVAGLALMATGALIASRLGSLGHVPTPGAPTASSLQATRAVRFVLVTVSATRVALVGDFNDWDASATPMRRDARSGVWDATLRLAPGCHSYAFVLDGNRWVPDPQAPLAPADDFGSRHSVVVVGEKGT